MTRKLKIPPSERLGLKLSRRHREILLDTGRLDRDLIDRIQTTAGNRPMVEFTLEELARLAQYATAEAADSKSKAAREKLRTIADRITALEEIFELKQ